LEKKDGIFDRPNGQIALALHRPVRRFAFYAKQENRDTDGDCIKCKDMRHGKSKISTQPRSSQPADPTGDMLRP
jgi:hypothetical protein